MDHPLIRRFDVGTWLVAETQRAHLVGREIGRRCREALEEQLDTTAAGAVTTVDGSGIGHLDFTGADECFVKIIQRLHGGEYGDIYLVFAGFTPTHEENLVVALERKTSATVIQRKDGPAIIGHLNPYLLDAYRLVKKARAATARDWADMTGDPITLGSTKLLTLYKQHLVQRTSERMPSGGRQFVYRLVEGAVSGHHGPRRD